VTGSKTGPDGAGNAAARFVSKSGRVVLTPSDFFFQNCGKPFRAGFEIKWSCRPLFADPVAAPAAPSKGVESAVTLIQQLPNGRHVLELKGKLPIKTLRVYRPAYGGK
jgi:hypothetical protein